MSNDVITVHKRRKWSAVPDDVLEDIRLSLRARAVLGWMLGRPDGWEIQIEHMLRVLGMTEFVWAAIRTELQQAGYYRQTWVRQANGTLAWFKDVLDPPEPLSPTQPGMVETIRGSAMDGSAARGSAIHGCLGDIPPGSKHDEEPPPPTAPKEPRQRPTSKQAESVVAVGFLDELAEAAFWKSRQSGKSICNLNGWRATVRKRIQQKGPSPEDKDCLQEWREAMSAPPKPESTAVTEIINPDPALREQRRSMLSFTSKKLKAIT
ncbi:MAG: hypothetical protein Q8O52_00550 [Sulfuritalea sp.]|nr:hypothetical protein [Sulfuritalea sp.]